jgi:general secretion pathway protein H
MPPARAGRKLTGFTLVELMVVMVIIGITLGLATLNVVPSPRQELQKEAQRIALLLQMARDEAIVRNRLVTFEADSQHYHFLVRNETRWDPITNDDLLRERTFRNAPLQLLLDPPSAGTTNPLRITFGREPVDKPFTLTLATADASVAIHADGVGHFTVEQ